MKMRAKRRQRAWQPRSFWTPGVTRTMIGAGPNIQQISRAQAWRLFRSDPELKLIESST